MTAFKLSAGQASSTSKVMQVALEEAVDQFKLPREAVVPTMTERARGGGREPVEESMAEASTKRSAGMEIP